MSDAPWDHIVVGAGSAGCALAASLAWAGRRVLVLESGGPDTGRWLRIPLGVGRIIRDPRVVWRFETEPEPGAGNRRLYWPRGRVLGGSSSVNGMIWVRGDPARYDAWAASGCAGWDWAGIEPHMRAIENFPEGDAARGHEGPVSIEKLRGHDPVTDAFIQACTEVGIPATPDYNGPQHEGVGRLQVNTRRGVRCSAAVAYLRPAMASGNLAVETDAHVRRVIFEARRAIGVEYDQGGTRRTAVAGGDIILAAGAIQSPQVLELSGIGDGARLGALGIDSVVHLPGVGENLSDHFHIRATYRAAGTVTINDLLRRPWLHGPPAWLRYQVTGTGLFAGATATAHALARTTPESERPDTKLQLHKISSGDRTAEAAGMGVDPHSGLSIGFFQLYPESRGSVHAVSTDPREPPRIVANYLAAAADRAAALRGLRLARRIGAQPALRAFMPEETRPGPDVEDDAALLEFCRATGQTSYHPVGTCRMGTDDLAVVDTECRVRGIDGLRVVDASVMPFIVSSNTNAPSIAIGERAAAILLAGRNQLR